MVVCLVNQEPELLNVQYVVRALEQLKTRTESLVAKSSYRSIVQKPVGLFVQQVLSNVIIVTRKLRPHSARINNIAIWSAEIKGISIKQVSRLELGKVIKHLTLLYINGLHHIIRSLMFVNIAKRKAIQSGLTYLKIITEREMTGLISANHVILCMMANSIRTSDVINKYVDVIRKRYWKFVNDGDETGWETNTPAVV